MRTSGRVSLVIVGSVLVLAAFAACGRTSGNDAVQGSASEPTATTSGAGPTADNANKVSAAQIVSDFNHNRTCGLISTAEVEAIIGEVLKEDSTRHSECVY